ncbi:hypothetical protein [Tunturiibacter gelidoferens]|uniref:Uncharacterized protein n=1 Tax=Tunturiibacter gelidiferens TaxID=3069689 RepID=A0A9X0QJX9_9BACT|nr:hypothetical protein [Edaphobacter lichenicola]MBB5331788.1 hypothetical protein [Edaphobacter lichenicola]
MDTASILQEIDSEISRLEQAKAILSRTAVKRSPGRPKQTQSVIKTVAVEPTKRVMSAEGKARIAAAQKLRWAKSKRAIRKAAKKAVVKSVLTKKASASKAAPSKAI